MVNMVDVLKGRLLSADEIGSRTEIPKLHLPGQLFHSNTESQGYLWEFLKIVYNSVFL